MRYSELMSSLDSVVPKPAKDDPEPELWTPYEANDGEGALCGLFLIPQSWCIAANRTNVKIPGLKLYRIAFEFYRLPDSGVIKFSARIRAVGDFVARIQSLADNLECPTAQRSGVRRQTYSVAVWPLGTIPQATDYEGMAASIRNFLANPLPKFSEFVARTPAALTGPS